MAWVIGGKKFGQYTYEHWFDDEEYKNMITQKSEPDENNDSGKPEIPDEEIPDQDGK